MGGEQTEDPEQSSEVEDLGSVGDWRLPSWAHRIPGQVWVFVGLAIANLLTEVVYRIGWAASPVSLGMAIAPASHTLLILLPGLIIARARRTGRSARGPLLTGAIALSLSVLFSTLTVLVSGRFVFLTPDESWDLAPIVAALRIAAATLGAIGPILLGHSIIRLRRHPAPRIALVAGVGIFALTTLYVLLITLSSVVITTTLFAAAFDDPISGPGMYVLSDLVSGVSAFGWAYFAWAIVSGVSDRAGRRAGWALGLGAVIAQVASVAVYATITSISLAGFSTDPSDAYVAAMDAISAFFGVSSILFALSTCLFVAAFAAGLGTPRLAEPDAPRTGLDPLPSPG
jgi:hypothetical protein